MPKALYNELRDCISLTVLIKSGRYFVMENKEIKKLLSIQRLPDHGTHLLQE
jgi:hypothetical protein